MNVVPSFSHGSLVNTTFTVQPSLAQRFFFLSSFHKARLSGTELLGDMSKKPPLAFHRGLRWLQMCSPGLSAEWGEKCASGWLPWVVSSKAVLELSDRIRLLVQTANLFLEAQNE